MSGWTDPDLPLTSGQRVQLPSGVLPSGEANFFDFRQSDINKDFPYPNLSTEDRFAFEGQSSREQFSDQFSDEWWDASGVIKTFPESQSGVPQDSGILHFNNLLSNFSNARDITRDRLGDFNSYIHFEGNIQIPYVSTFKRPINFNPYQQ